MGQQQQQQQNQPADLLLRVREREISIDCCTAHGYSAMIIKERGSTRRTHKLASYVKARAPASYEKVLGLAIVCSRRRRPSELTERAREAASGADCARQN